MLEKLITDLKKSLPESLRRKLGGAEQVEEEEQEEQEESQEEESGESAPSSDEEKKKKRNSMIIKVVVICGLAYFAVDEFVLKKTSEPTVEELLAKAPKRKRPKPVKAEAAKDVAPADATAAATTPAAETTTAPVDSTPTAASTEASPAEAAPIENINVMDKAETTSTPPVVEETHKEEAPVVTETRIPEPNVDQKLDQLVENVEQTAPSNPVEEVKVPSKGEETPEVASTPTPAASMASKIVEGITETPPPAYDQVGRGLVYNCKDKYWACLDKPAYVTCNKNMKWNKSKGNSAECVVASIYGSEDDCAKVQKYNVSTSAPTAFCQN